RTQARGAVCAGGPVGGRSTRRGLETGRSPARQQRPAGGGNAAAACADARRKRMCRTRRAIAGDTNGGGGTDEDGLQLEQRRTRGRAERDCACPLAALSH